VPGRPVACQAIKLSLSALREPRRHRKLPVQDLAILEPECDLPLAILGRIAAVDDVSADTDSKVPPDGARLGLQRVGRADELACRCYDAVTF
jgi:hypothetical protein